MDFWNFSDITFLTFFIAVVSSLAIIVFLIITLSTFSKNETKGTKQIKNETFNTRIYVIDVKKNVVTYFSKSNLRAKKHVDLNGFYQRFNPEDVEKVKSWIFNICLDFKNADPYLEIDILSDKGKDSYFSLLKLLKYNAVEGLIHAESHVLKYISSSGIQKKSNRKGLPTGLIKRGDMEEIVNKEKSAKGFTFAIRFYYKKQTITSNEKIERYMMMTLKNVVYPFGTNSRYPRQIIDEGENEILLFDLKIDSTEEAMKVAKSISADLKKCIGVNGFANSIDFAIGVIQNSEYYQDFNSIIFKAQESCMSGQHNGTDVVMYQKQASPLVELDKYKHEISKLLKPNGLRYLFRPIIDTHKHKVLGYFSYVKAYDTPFSNYKEMAKYASMFQKSTDLFATVAKYVIQKFSSEAEDSTMKVFLRASFLDINNIVPVLNQISEIKKVKVVLVFDEQEINENSENLESLNQSLKAIREGKFRIAMLMKDKNLLLDSSVYENFDYFVAGSSMIGEIKINNRSRLSIHSLIEQLLKYNKPIIATDLESWQSIELILKSGISIISTEVISPSNDMLLPIEKKKLDKLVEMDEKYN